MKSKQWTALALSAALALALAAPAAAAAEGNKPIEGENSTWIPTAEEAQSYVTERRAG